MSRRLAWLLPTLLVGHLAAACGGGDPASLPDADLPDGHVPDGHVPDAAPTCDDIACVHGACALADGLPTCACDPGFAGDACDALDAPDPSDVAFWLDAADAASIETDDEARVTSWRDKSDFAVESDVPEEDEEKPTVLLDGLNGLPVVRFDNDLSQNCRWNGVTAFTDGNRYTMFIVFTVSDKGHAILSGSGGGSSIDLWRPNTETDPIAYRHNPADGDPSVVESSFGWEPGSPHLLTVRRSDTDMTIWVDGKHRVDVPAENTVKINSAIELNIGPGAGSYFDGDYAELIVVSGSLDLAERRKVEAYLGAKWFGAAPEPDITTFVSASIWLDASESDSVLHANGLVANWMNRGHAGGYFTQNLGDETRPEIVAGGLNGRDVVRFDGDDSLWRSGVEWTSDTAYDAYAVLVPADMGGTLTAFVALDGDDPGVRLNVLPGAGLIEFIHRWPASAAGGDNASLSVGGFGEPILVQLQRRPQMQIIYVGSEARIVAPEEDAIDAASLDFVLGAESALDPEFGFVGDIGELIFVQSQTSLAERLAVVDALREKWGL
jgi:hypothetical protein